MMKTTVFQTLNRLFEIVYQLLLLHFLWLTGTALGGVIFGIGPSTVALFSALRKRKKIKNDYELITLFKKSYLAEFKEANILFFIVMIIGTIIFLNISFLLTIETTLRYPFLFTLFILAYIYICASAVLFPISVHYDITIGVKLLFAIKFGIGYSVNIFLTGFLLFVSYFLLLRYAFPVIILFGIVPATYLLSELSRYLIIKVDSNNKKDMDYYDNNN